jgi:pimeloyl-ACP methyl ester carboxylesterase
MTTPPSDRDDATLSESFRTANGLRGMRWGRGDRVFVGLHGWNGSTATFAPLAPHLPEDVSVVAFDLPGYGDSPEPEAWSMESIASTLVDAIESQSLTSCSVIGNCSGTASALYVAREARARGLEIERLVVLEPFGYVPWYLRLLLFPLVGWFFYWIAFGTSLGRRITDAVLADKRDDSIDLMAAFADSPLHVPYRYLEEFHALPPPESFGDVPGDKTIVQTEHTFRAVRASVERFQLAWPNADVHHLDSAGHLPLEERPDAVATLLE